MRGKQRHRFAQIERGSSPHRNDAVGGHTSIVRQRLQHSGFSGIRGRIVEYLEAEFRREVLPQPIEQAAGADTLVCDDQGATDAEPLAFLAYELDGAVVELNGGEVADGSHSGRFSLWGI